MPKPTVPTGFDWNSVPAKDRKWLKGVTADINAATARVRTDLIAIGQWIASAKEKLPHGTFDDWCKSALPCGKRTAINLLQVAKVFGGDGSKNATDAHLPKAVERIEPGAMYALASPSCPPTAREKALALAETGETITQEKARQFIDAARKSDPPRNRGEPHYVCLQDVIDRAEAAVEDGRIRLADVPEPPEDVALPIPLWMLGRLYRIFFPEEFPDDPPEPPPFDAPPGSDAKIEEMQRRAEKGLALCGRADPGLDDPRGVTIAKRSGGAGKVMDGIRQAPAAKPLGWGKGR